jgi:hypothetical protein
MKGLIIIIGILVVLATSYGLWMLKRKINYAFQYESLVLETIQQQVKPNCLTNKQ